MTGLRRFGRKMPQMVIKCKRIPPPKIPIDSGFLKLLYAGFEGVFPIESLLGCPAGLLNLYI